MIQKPQRQIAPVYHRRIGEIVVTALSDGTLTRSIEMMHNVPRALGQAYFDDVFRPGPVISVNAFLVYSAGKMALIETGSGHYLGDTTGFLLQSLKAAGVAPETIETILITHMHPDHSAGLVDMTTGKQNYPNAELIMHENEPRHWFDDAAMARGTDREKALFFKAGREQVEPYRKRWKLFARESEVFPGVTAVPAIGHTPGHSAYLVQSGNERLLIWGDTVHIPEVQIPRPEVTMTVDTDHAAAAASRKRMFDMCVSEQLLVTGMHLHFPGFGRLARRGSTYEYVPEVWQQTF